MGDSERCSFEELRSPLRRPRGTHDHNSIILYGRTRLSSLPILLRCSVEQAALQERVCRYPSQGGLLHGRLPGGGARHRAVPPDRAGYVGEVVRPLQAKLETAYVVAGSDAEAHVARRFPHKTVKRVSNGLRPASIQGFLNGLPLVFQ